LIAPRMRLALAGVQVRALLRNSTSAPAVLVTML
jgi:hypothetical protein